MKKPADLKVLIMAGGTGGHVFPALAVAEELRLQGANIIWLGTARGIEAELVVNANIPLHYLRVEGVRGRGLMGLFKAPFLIFVALLQALRVVSKERPDLVLGFGGFASGPGGVAAFLLRKPLLIHEQNAIAGTTNRLLAPIAKRVLTAFAHVFKQAEVVGNPVRASIQSVPPARERMAQRAGTQGSRHLLILGGSLGAQAINSLVPEALAKMSAAVRPQIWHQAGKQHAEATLANYMQHQVNAKVEPFIIDMAAAYAWADLVICRAGALTVSELAAAGVPAIFIPLPSAIDDHQTHNAAILVNAGGAFSCPQHELTAAGLAELLTPLMVDSQKLLMMAESARHLAMPQAAHRVAEICLEVACE